MNLAALGTARGRGGEFHGARAPLTGNGDQGKVTVDRLTPTSYYVLHNYTDLHLV